MQAAVTLHIDAEPQKVWELISDITKMGEYSPEVFEAEWLDGATGPEVGAMYRGHVKRNERGPTYWTKCRVTESVPGVVFEFAVVGPGDRAMNTWRYVFDPAEEGGTNVTESFKLTESLLTTIFGLLGGQLRTNRNKRDMLRTLERVKAAAET